MKDIELLKDIRNKTKESDLFFRKREEALSVFHEMPMPSSKLEAWKYTEIKDLDLNQFPNTSQEIEFHISEEDTAKGVIFTNIKNALHTHFNIIKENMPMGLVDVAEDKFTAMHAAFWDDGVF